MVGHVRNHCLISGYPQSHPKSLSPGFETGLCDDITTGKRKKNVCAMHNGQYPVFCWMTLSYGQQNPKSSGLNKPKQPHFLGQSTIVPIANSVFCWGYLMICDSHPYLWSKPMHERICEIRPVQIRVLPHEIFALSSTRQCQTFSGRLEDTCTRYRSSACCDVGTLLLQRL